MIRFSAKHTAVIDDKGRVVLPAAFKKAMGEQADLPLIIEKDAYAGCLNIYPEIYWNQKMDAVESKISQFNEDDIEFLEEFYENFTTAKMAANGRLNIPLDFLEHANAKKEVVLSGLGKMIRLWDATSFKERKAARGSYKDSYRAKLDNNPKSSE